MNTFATRSLFFLSLSIFFMAFLGCKGSQKSTSTVDKTTSKVHFVKSKTLTDVLEDAEKQNKLVFVDFYTDWCLPCKLMDEDVFTDKNVAKFMNDNFLSYKVNAEKDNGPNLAFVYEVRAYPTLLFLDSKGDVLEKKIGAAFHTELMAMGKQALSKSVTQ